MSELRTHPADLNLSPKSLATSASCSSSPAARGRWRTCSGAGRSRQGHGKHARRGRAPISRRLQRGRFQFLRAEPTLSAARDLPHPAILRAHALIRLEGARLTLRYEEGVRKLIEPRGGTVETLAGVQRPRSYTSWHDPVCLCASARAPTWSSMPHGCGNPQNKTAAWWTMDWMQRELFLATLRRPGTPCRQGPCSGRCGGDPLHCPPHVHAPERYGCEGLYDFVPYFEFAEEHAPIFRAVMAALRDTDQNPEWAYVREGPEWWGRRVGYAAALWEDRPGQDAQRALV